MTRHQPAFKETQIFDWETEPKSERPSEFHSTGFSTASGYYHSLEGSTRTKARRRRGTSFAPLIIGLLVFVCMGMVCVEFLARLLRA